MIMKYIGNGESVPQLGMSKVENGEVISVQNERHAQELLATLRWLDVNAKPKKQPTVQNKPAPQDKPETLTKPARQKSSTAKGVEND